MDGRFEEAKAGIEEWIVSLEQITVTLVQNLQSTQYEAMLEFIDERESLISQILAQPLLEPVISRHKETINRILAYDSLISSRLSELKEVEKAGISKTKNARLQKSIYEAPLLHDSIYFDKKK